MNTTTIPTTAAEEQPASSLWQTPRTDGSGRMIHVEGNFDFSVYRNFRDAYRDLPAGVPVDVDLSRATYIDSAALGMLLMLREHVGSNGEGYRITLHVSPAPEIHRIVELAGLGELFKLA